MRSEQQFCTDLLLHFGRVPVIKKSVSIHIFIHRGEIVVLLRYSTSTRHSTSSINDDSRILNESQPDEWRKRHCCRSDIATRSRDKLRANQSITMQFGQTINGSRQQLGLIVYEAVPLRICRSIFEAICGREIDNTTNFADKCWGQGQAGLVR